MPFTFPVDPGKCATPLAITDVEASVDFPIDGSTARTGEGRINLVSDVAWFYSDTPGSGRKMLIAAGQSLVLPFYDNLTIGAATVTGSGTLYAMLMDTVSVR
jgi:hypothetical protein